MRLILIGLTWGLTMSLVNNATADPKKSLRGDIWWVNLNPTVGSEINKPRPCVLINTDGVIDLSVRLAVPLTEWKQHKEEKNWCVAIDPTVHNGLEKKVVADISQTRAISIERLNSKIGFLAAETLEEVIAALAAFVEFA